MKLLDVAYIHIFLIYSKIIFEDSYDEHDLTHTKISMATGTFIITTSFHFDHFAFITFIA